VRLMSKNSTEPLRIGWWKQDLRVHCALGGTESEAKELELRLPLLPGRHAG